MEEIKTAEAISYLACVILSFVIFDVWTAFFIIFAMYYLKPTHYDN